MISLIFDEYFDLLIKKLFANEYLVIITLLNYSSLKKFSIKLKEKN